MVHQTVFRSQSRTGTWTWTRKRTGIQTRTWAQTHGHAHGHEHRHGQGYGHLTHLESFNFIYYFFKNQPIHFVADTFCPAIRFVADMFCCRYVLSPTCFVADMFCCRYVLSPIYFVADMFCHRYVLSPICFGPIHFVRYVLSTYQIYFCISTTESMECKIAGAIQQCGQGHGNMSGNM